MHFGSGPTGAGDDDQENDSYDASDDPFVVEDHLIELGECHKFSKSVFFIVSSTFYHSSNYPDTTPSTQPSLWSVGEQGVKGKYLCLTIYSPLLQALLGTEIGNLIPPTNIDTATYELLLGRCTTQTEINLLQNCYGKVKETIPSSSALSSAASEGEEKYVLCRDYR